jgi:hypothetical protein
MACRWFEARRFPADEGEPRGLASLAGCQAPVLPRFRKPRRGPSPRAGLPARRRGFYGNGTSVNSNSRGTVWTRLGVS